MKLNLNGKCDVITFGTITRTPKFWKWDSQYIEWFFDSDITKFGKLTKILYNPKL